MSFENPNSCSDSDAWMDVWESTDEHGLVVFERLLNTGFTNEEAGNITCMAMRLEPVDVVTFLSSLTKRNGARTEFFDLFG